MARETAEQLSADTETRGLFRLDVSARPGAGAHLHLPLLQGMTGNPIESEATKLRIRREWQLVCAALNGSQSSGAPPSGRG